MIPFETAEALSIGGAVFCTAGIHAWVDDFTPACAAPSGRLILEEFHRMSAEGTIDIKYITWFPVSHVLTGALHNNHLLYNLNIIKRCVTKVLGVSQIKTHPGISVFGIVHRLSSFNCFNCKLSVSQVVLLLGNVSFLVSEI